MKEAIAKMIALARLKFPAEEMDRFASKAEHILEYVEMLEEIDAKNLEATSHAIEVINAFREDQVHPFENASKILEIAPDHDQNLFEVPKVIDED